MNENMATAIALLTLKGDLKRNELEVEDYLDAIDDVLITRSREGQMFLVEMLVGIARTFLEHHVVGTDTTPEELLQRLALGQVLLTDDDTTGVN